MALRARQVLVDCEHALADFSASANTEFQRPRWVALITLLRTVLDVVHKVDRPASGPEAQRRIDDARKRLFGKKPEPRIYHEFIEDERNDTVHLFEIGAVVDVAIHPGSATAATYTFFMRDGPYRGRSPIELGREAIEFWDGYLNDIDGP